MGGSRFVAARRADPDLAEIMLELEEQAQRMGRKPRSSAPRDAEWTNTEELLTQLIDMVGALIAVEASHPLPKGTKPKKPPPPRPRPQRGVDIARMRRRTRYLNDLEADVVAAQARWEAQQNNN